MRFVVLLGTAAIVYGIAYEGAGVSQGWSLALGWLAGFVALFLVSRWRGYRAAYKVETWRARAEQLRRDDPERYQQILGEASGEAAGAAAQDPDAFVALWLEAASNIRT